MWFFIENYSHPCLEMDAVKICKHVCNMKHSQWKQVLLGIIINVVLLIWSVSLGKRIDHNYGSPEETV